MARRGLGQDRSEGRNRKRSAKTPKRNLPPPPLAWGPGDEHRSAIAQRMATRRRRAAFAFLRVRVRTPSASSALMPPWSILSERVSARA